MCPPPLFPRTTGPLLDNSTLLIPLSIEKRSRVLVSRILRSSPGLCLDDHHGAGGGRAGCLSSARRRSLSEHGPAEHVCADGLSRRGVARGRVGGFAGLGRRRG